MFSGQRDGGQLLLQHSERLHDCGGSAFHVVIVEAGVHAHICRRTDTSQHVAQIEAEQHRRQRAALPHAVCWTELDLPSRPLQQQESSSSATHSVVITARRRVYRCTEMQKRPGIQLSTFRGARGTLSVCECSALNPYAGKEYLYERRGTPSSNCCMRRC